MGLKSTLPPRAGLAPRKRLCIALLLALQAAAVMAADTSPERDALLAQARQEHDAGKRVDALAHCQAILARWPTDRDAQALNVTLLTELGASTRAGELAARLDPAPGIAERFHLGADHVAQEIRWAEGEPADPAHPYAEADRAVTDARRLVDDPLLPAELRQRAEFDLLVALDRAGRADEAVSRYDALKARGVTLPPYAGRAVADALLVKRRPKEAAALYEDAIARDPGPYDVNESEPRIGLMYAYLESGQTRKAFATIDELAAKEPQWRRVPGMRLPLQNARKVDADLNAATLREYVDMPADAYARLEPMSREAPNNAQIRRELGMVELARGWPRRAQDDFNIAGTLDRRDVGAYIGEADAARVLNDYEGVDENLAMARTLADRNGRVDRAVKAWDRERGWQFDIGTEQGKGSSPDFGDRDGTTQATVASPLIDDHWRVLALARYSTADLPEGEVRRSRVGVGIRGYARGLEAYVQALPATDRYVGKTALEAGFDWAITDHWSWAADYSTAGEDTPLRAQYYGISAKTLDTAVTWRASELTQARVGLSRDRFSDGNERTGWLANAIQRLHTAPNLTLDGGIELGGSMNSETERPYFNPRRDYSYALTGRLENLLGQFYERSVTQRIDVAVGQYAEKGFATDWMATVRYGQTILAGPGFRFGWGLGWHNQPYDGRREHRFVLDLTMHWGE
ncbi:biofilm PGA synthesis protein PgaA [Luteibacter sp. UNCMF331Sha3.1]|uniref:poly-beta-1,6 N-acetyl-D-glucosamine export porin PgaA n=1 Tax=Luteibacter sp. UNCMF331Sha3.1 TaxID=1502760 RepID=UPI0008D6382A|nr:poly-beta-1,6 N-acetyl-D-glucosamine export porin PgaA [Luteibacter sp. UNCMF331Sha3.1]SEN35380.1 biofilm PGA synthesis protein PgaA [Luteibacter sp. UNCMF331Sha3.1]